jgi:hypothetical protein
VVARLSDGWIEVHDGRGWRRFAMIVSPSQLVGAIESPASGPWTYSRDAGVGEDFYDGVPLLPVVCPAACVRGAERSSEGWSTESACP